MTTEELAEVRSLKDKVTTYESLLMKLLASGQFVGTSDGIYWQQQISNALGLHSAPKI